MKISYALIRIIFTISLTNFVSCHPISLGILEWHEYLIKLKLKVGMFSKTSDNVRGDYAALEKNPNGRLPSDKYTIAGELTGKPKFLTNMASVKGTTAVIEFSLAQAEKAIEQYNKQKGGQNEQKGRKGEKTMNQKALESCEALLKELKRTFNKTVKENEMLVNCEFGAINQPK